MTNFIDNKATLPGTYDIEIEYGLWHIEKIQFNSNVQCFKRVSLNRSKTVKIKEKTTFTNLILKV